MIVLHARIYYLVLGTVLKLIRFSFINFIESFHFLFNYITIKELMVSILLCVTLSTYHLVLCLRHTVTLLVSNLSKAVYLTFDEFLFHVSPMLGIAISLIIGMQARGHTQFPGSHPVSLNRFCLFDPLIYCHLMLL